MIKVKFVAAMLVPFLAGFFLNRYLVGAGTPLWERALLIGAGAGALTWLAGMILGLNKVPTRIPAWAWGPFISVMMVVSILYTNSMGK